MRSRTRRQLLLGVASGSALSVAGCVNVLEQFEDDDNSEPATPDRRTRENDGNQESDSSASETEDSTEVQTESPTETEDRPENYETRRETVDLYGEGISQANDGLGEREQSVGAMNEDNFQTAEERASASVEHFRDAEESFDDALDLAYEIGVQEAIDICGDASEYVTLSRRAMERTKQAAQNAQDDDFETADEYIDDSRELEREAERVNPRDTSVLARVLEVD